MDLLTEFRKIFPNYEGAVELVSSPAYLIKLLHKERENHQHLKRKYNTLVHDNWRLLDAYEKHRRIIMRLKKEKSYLLDKIIELEEVALNENNKRPRDGDDADEPSKKRRRRSKKDDEPNAEGAEGAAGSSSTTNTAQASEPKKRDRSRRRRDRSKEAGGEKEDAPMCGGMGKDGQGCKSRVLEGLSYCWHHAPLDPNSGLSFCTYVNPRKNYKKCNIPVPKDDEIGYCKFHKKKFAITDTVPGGQKSGEVADDPAELSAKSDEEIDIGAEEEDEDDEAEAEADADDKEDEEDESYEEEEEDGEMTIAEE